MHRGGRKLSHKYTQDNVETHDSSDRFSSSTKLLKTKERKCHATDLLKGVISAKRKVKEGGDEEVLWK